jgi:hypothetical protein
MVNRAKQKGTLWESTIVAYLQGRGWVNAERRAGEGVNDRGDITGIVGVVIEAKNEKTITLAQYLKETQTEMRNANTTIGAAWIKKRGTTDPGQSYVLMDGNTFTQLLKEAGY